MYPFLLVQSIFLTASYLLWDVLQCRSLSFHFAAEPRHTGPVSSNASKTVYVIFCKESGLIKPRLHLPLSSYDFSVCDFLYEFLDIV